MPKRREPKAGEPPANTPKLSEDAQIYVVTSLALWVPEAEILKKLADEFTPPGEKPVSQQNLWSYNPRNPKCPPRWRELHAETRKAYVEGVAELAGSSKAWRIDKLLRLQEKAEKAGNLVLAAALLKQIAEDHGDVYTKVRELTGPGGTPLPGNVIQIAAVDLLAGLRGEPPVATVPEEPEPTE